MHDKAADDHVDAVVIEGQVGDVGGAHLDPVGDALEFGVAQRVLLRVVGLVGPPDVDADRSAVRQQLGGCEQDSATAAAEVEQCLIAAQPQTIEDLRPDFELASTRVVRMNRAAVVTMDAPVPPVTTAATGLPRARLLAADASSPALTVPTMVTTVGADTER